MNRKILNFLSLLMLAQFLFSITAFDAKASPLQAVSAALATEESEAVSKAKSFLRFEAYSRSGLIEQLEYEGFSHAAAVYGADHCDANWYDQAVKSAESYLEFSAFSQDGLIKQLIYEKFTHDEATTAVENMDVDWNEQAVASAKSYLSFESFSRDGLIHQLEYEGFTNAEATYGADHSAADADEPADDDSANSETITPTDKDKNVADQKGNEQMLDVLVANLDNLFPIRAMEDKFPNPSPATYSDVGPATAIQISNQEGTRNIAMYANADGVHDYTAVTKLSAGNLQNFYLSMDVTTNDVYPADQGGCFIGYVNESLTGSDAGESVATVELLLSDSKIFQDAKEKEANAGAHSQLSTPSLSKYKSELRIVRLTGQTFFFLGDQLIGQYHDGKTGPFQLIYGTTVFKGGDTASCSFDNLVVRKVVK